MPAVVPHVENRVVLLKRAYRGPNPHMHLIGADFHFPYHDPHAVRLFLEFAQEHQPKYIHLLGDLIDFYPISKFCIDPRRELSLQEELDEAAAFLAQLRDTCPTSHIILSEGNHEARLWKYLYRGPKALSTLRGLTVPALLGLEEKQISWWGAEMPYQFAGVHFTHGDKDRAIASNVVRYFCEAYGGSVIIGHIHRFATYHFSGRTYDYRGWSVGCLADPAKQNYALCPNWQLGWSVLWHVEGTFEVEHVQLVRGEYVWHGARRGRYIPEHGKRPAADLSDVLCQ